MKTAPAPSVVLLMELKPQNTTSVVKWMCTERDLSIIKLRQLLEDGLDRQEGDFYRDERDSRLY